MDDVEEMGPLTTTTPVSLLIIDENEPSDHAI
jgi:hypothetical protein